MGRRWRAGGAVGLEHPAGDRRVEPGVACGDSAYGARGGRPRGCPSARSRPRRPQGTGDGARRRRTWSAPARAGSWSPRAAGRVASTPSTFFIRRSISTTSTSCSGDGGGHLGPVRALGHDLEAAAAAQDPAEPGADQLLVVDERAPGHDGSDVAHLKTFLTAQSTSDETEPTGMVRSTSHWSASGGPGRPQGAAELLGAGRHAGQCRSRRSPRDGAVARVAGQRGGRAAGRTSTLTVTGSPGACWSRWSAPPAAPGRSRALPWAARRGQVAAGVVRSPGARRRGPPDELGDVLGAGERMGAGGLGGEQR